MLVDIGVVVALLVGYAVFKSVGKYAECRGVVRTPERNLSYGSKDLRDIASGSREYVVPILFPLDLIVMVILSAVLSFAALRWGPHAIDVLNALTARSIHPAWVVLPALAYLIVDFLEDSLLALLLTYRLPIGMGTVLPLKALTVLKFVALLLAVAVAAAGAAAVLYRYLFV